MTAPLNKDGSNFPAKKYATKAKLDSLKPVATLVAGKEFTWGLGGTATHNGGSCQVAIRCVPRDASVIPLARSFYVAADRSRPRRLKLTQGAPHVQLRHDGDHGRDSELGRGLSIITVRR
jgi:hypothetical protein